VDLNRFDKIRIVRKEQSPNSDVLQTSVTKYSLELAASELARICNESSAKYSRESFKVRAMSVMNILVNEGFFADIVVVVEGTTEVCTLWKLQEILGKNWPKSGIVIVPAGGKNNIDRPAVIFKGLKIPTYFIFDADAQLIGRGDSEKEAVKRNHRYLRLANEKLEDFPSSRVSDSWAVFGANLEGEIESALGDTIYHDIQKAVAAELGYDDCEKACKNIEGAALLRKYPELYQRQKNGKGQNNPYYFRLFEAVALAAHCS
jgi:hypothetical protein